MIRNSAEYRELKAKAAKGSLTADEQKKLKDLLDKIEEEVRNLRGLVSSTW